MHRPTGQTLVEVLLALTIIIVGIVSLVSALINTQSSATASIEGAVATQLGKEAIEAARFVRDSNWLERENGQTANFNDGLESATEANDYTGVYLWNPTKTDPNQAVVFDYTADASSSSNAIVYQNSSGLYRQFTTAPGVTWTPTLYQRYVTLFPICSSDGGQTEQYVTADGTDCATSYPGTTQIGVDVLVTVSWTSRGTAHSRDLETRLYDWKYAQS